MVHFSCPCLNVQVHGRGATPPLQDVTDIHLSEETAADSFFSPDTYVVTMDICGVTKAQNLLCKDRAVDGWIITTCTCCKFDVCASHADELHRVLVNSAAKKDCINSLMQSNRYSRLFQMILPDINDNFIQNNLGVERQNSNLDSSVEHVQKLVTNFLKNEQKEMENRIREFTEAQQSSYTDLLQKIRKQKQSIIYLLMKSKETQAPNQNDEDAQSPLTPAKGAKDSCDEKKKKSFYSEINLAFPTIESTSTDSAFDTGDASLSYGRTAKKPIGRSLRRTLSTPARSDNKEKKVHRRPPVNIDVGGVFDMEEFDSKEEYSEEDSEGSEGSNVEDSNNEKSKDEMMCATSLPMSIPAFSHYSHFSLMDDDEEEDYKTPLPKNPEEIAASIRALACSVTDGTEMFGELPRRRLNTGELLSSRPL